MAVLPSRPGSAKPKQQRLPTPVVPPRPGSARPEQQGLPSPGVPSRPSPIEQNQEEVSLIAQQQAIILGRSAQPENQLDASLVAREQAIILGRSAEPVSSSPAMQWAQLPAANSPQAMNPPPTPRHGSDAGSRRGSLTTQHSSPVLPNAEPPTRLQRIVTLQLPAQRNLLQQQQQRRRSSVSSGLPSSPVVPSQAVPMVPPNPVVFSQAFPMVPSQARSQTVPASPIMRPSSRPMHIQIPPHEIPANWAVVPPHLRLASQVLPSQLRCQYIPRRFSQPIIDPSTSHAAHHRLAQFQMLQRQSSYGYQPEPLTASMAMAGPSHPMPLIRRASDTQRPVSPVSRTMSMPLAMPGLSPSQVEARSRQLGHGDYMTGNPGVEFMRQQTQGFLQYPNQHHQQHQYSPHQQYPSYDQQ